MRSGLDPKVVPMVDFFNQNGLKTKMSCQGHNKTNMSMFWIEFDERVTQDDILEFMRGHLNFCGIFTSNGRFAKRISGYYNAKTLEWQCRECWCYFAATQEAADGDLVNWMYDSGDFDGVEGEAYQAWRSKMIEYGKLQV